MANQLLDVTPGPRPVYKEGDPNTITYNSTAGLLGGTDGESVTVPTNLYASPAPGRTQAIYSSVMPPEGYKFGYDNQGFRYTVPEDYAFRKPGGQPLENDPMPYAEFNPFDPGTATPLPTGYAPQPSMPMGSTTLQPNVVITGNEIVQPAQSMISSEIGNMTDEERLRWAQTRNSQRDVKNPEEQALINSILSGTYRVPATAENTVATTTQEMTNLPAYSTNVSGGQQIISGTPQTPDEVNIVDYYGTMADRPVLQPETQLAPQIQKQVVQPGEIQGQVPLPTQTPMATAGIATAQQVGAPTISPTALATTQLAGTADRPAVTKVEALKSYEQVDEAADAFQAAQLDLENIDPRATVQGQLALLQEQFAGGQTPIWAQGAMKQASALMAQRGIGNSTMAAEAITNALMQSAIPIAQQDSSFYQSVTMQNLVNEQEVEITKFNARLSSIFNDQAAENTARNINAQTENDTARFFTELSQNVVMANTAAVNAMRQFNANTMNQANQFASEMGLQADTINAQMANEMAQFNGEQLLNVSKFNASMKDAREKFNVQNQIAIDANNIQWRRSVNTANTAATNAAIQTDVQNLLGLQQSALNNIWNHYDTLLNMAFQTEENEKDRAVNVAIATLDAEARKKLAEDGANSNLIGDIFEGAITLLGSDSAWNRISGWF